MSEAGAPRRRLGRAYWRLWWASGADSVGNGMFTAAAPLLAATVTHDPRLVTLVPAATQLPWLLLSLPVGSLVDHHSRVALMRRSQFGQAAIVGVLAACATYGQVNITVLTTLALLLGALDVLHGNAGQALLPDLVDNSLLYKANGHQQAITTVGLYFAGPPIGSLLFAVCLALPFWLDALSFALSAALLTALRKPASPGERSPKRLAITEGLRWLVRHRLLRTLAALLGVNTFCGQLANATLVLLATRTLGLDERGYGLLLACAAVGSLLSGLVSDPVVAKFGAVPILVTALALNAVAFVGIGLSPNVGVLAVLLSVNGFVTTVWNIVTVSRRQQLVPADLLGRVNSVYRMLGRGLIAFGALAGGLVAYRFGVRAPYPVAGILRAIALVFALPVLLEAGVNTLRRRA